RWARPDAGRAGVRATGARGAHVVCRYAVPFHRVIFIDPVVAAGDRAVADAIATAAPSTTAATVASGGRAVGHLAGGAGRGAGGAGPRGSGEWDVADLAVAAVVVREARHRYQPTPVLMF